jgi:hypothetical protein
MLALEEVLAMLLDETAPNLQQQHDTMAGQQQGMPPRPPLPPPLPPYPVSGDSGPLPAAPMSPLRLAKLGLLECPSMESRLPAGMGSSGADVRLNRRGSGSVSGSESSERRGSRHTISLDQATSVGGAVSLGHSTLRPAQVRGGGGGVLFSSPLTPYRLSCMRNITIAIR